MTIRDMCREIIRHSITSVYAQLSTWELLELVKIKLGTTEPKKVIEFIKDVQSKIPKP